MAELVIIANNDWVMWPMGAWLMTPVNGGQWRWFMVDNDSNSSWFMVVYDSSWWWLVVVVYDG